ncbi:MAG: hypothetical protein QOE65_2892 [Solirubrobacteraceae bacterium]|jgi:uncharacterized membrane protein YkoI|nr:hypothetical protein [Solirubrobacteraceae bacterium]
MFDVRSNLMTVAAIAAAAVGGGAIANAAASGSTSTAPKSQSRPQAPTQRHTVGGRTEQPLTGDTESKVRAAALAKAPGTVERVETNVDGSAPYEAHIRKSDGSEVEVQVSKDFTVSAVNAMGGPDGRHP